MNLEEKAVEIKGKKYILVKDRVLHFNENYKAGCIITERLSCDDKVIGFKAKVVPDASQSERFFTGHASETIGDGYINEASALENAETSAVGRALAMMGIGVVDSIASTDEMTKAQNAHKNFNQSGGQESQPKQHKHNENFVMKHGPHTGKMLKDIPIGFFRANANSKNEWMRTTSKAELARRAIQGE